MAFSKNSKCSEIGPRGVMASLIIKESVKIKKNKLGLSCAKLRANLAWLGLVWLGIGLLRLISLHTNLNKTLAIFISFGEI